MKNENKKKNEKKNTIKKNKKKNRGEMLYLSPKGKNESRHLMNETETENETVSSLETEAQRERMKN